MTVAGDFINRSGNSRSLSLPRALAIIAGVWFAAVAALALCSAFGLPYGMNVWPLGEDRSWVDWMQRSPGLALPRDYWSHHDRNPLNPWWYMAASPLINAADWGLYFVRKLVDLFLGAATFVLCDRLMRGEARRMSLAVAILAMFWNFSGYREQIIWNFLGAMGVSLVAISAFVHYIDSTRRVGALALAAGALFLLAAASYTLQLGIVVTFVGLSFFRGATKSASATVRSRLFDPSPWIEAVAMGAIGVTFLAIWYTTSRPEIEYFSPKLGGIAQRLAESLANLLWHVDYTKLLAATVDRMGIGGFVGATLILALGALIWGARFVDGEDVQAFARQAPWMLLVVAGVSLMLFVAEAGNPNWPPGSRSRMVQQFVSPALASIALAVIASSIMRRRTPHAGLMVFRLGFSILIAAVLLVGLEYNRQMVERTAVQRLLAEQFQAIDAKRHASHYIILTDYEPTTVWGTDGLSDTTARLLLGRPNVTLRFVQRRGAPEIAWAPFWNIVFMEDAVGIGAAALGVPAPMPYDDVTILRVHNGKLDMPETFDKEDFAGTRVDWRRSGPLHQGAEAVAVCPWRYNFDTARFLESGWSVVEPLPTGGSAVWMAAREAVLRTDSKCTGSVRIQVQLVGQMSQAILESLQVSAGGASARFKITSTTPDKGALLEATLATTSTSALTFSVGATIKPPGGDRNLAVMFHQIAIEPVGK